MGNHTNIPRSISSYVAEYCWSNELILWFVTINLQQKRKIVYWETVFFQLWFHDSPNFTQSLIKNEIPSFLRFNPVGWVIHKSHQKMAFLRSFNPFDWVLVLRVLGACVSLLHTSWWRSFHLPEKKGGSKARRWWHCVTCPPKKPPKQRLLHDPFGMWIRVSEFPWKRHKLTHLEITQKKIMSWLIKASYFSSSGGRGQSLAISFHRIWFILPVIK